MALEMADPSDFTNRTPDPGPSMPSGDGTSGDGAKEQNAPVLEARDLCKTYQQGDVTVPALNGVTLDVQQAEFVAVMGPSGSGKSTLLYLLSGIDTASSGDVLLAGQALSGRSDDELALIRRRRVGFIFQFYNLVPTLTAAENVALPLIIDGADLAAHHRRIDALLRTVGLWSRRDHKPDHLSGGEQQRVAIARALVNEPQIVLADEPTGNLDSRTGAQILELLHHCSAELGQTIVMVTHDAEAASYANRVIFLRDGVIADRMTLGADSDVGHILERFALLEESGEVN